MDKDEEAKLNFKNGYNCAQSVLMCYADELGLDQNTALKLSSSFGGGMGRLREVCGAVSAMFMVAGLKYGYHSPENNSDKARHYKLIQELAEEFKNENGSIICRELIGAPKKESSVPALRTESYYKVRPCVELVACAAKIIERLNEKLDRSNKE